MTKKAKTYAKYTQQAEQQMLAAKANLDKQMQLYKLAREKVAASTKVACLRTQKKERIIWSRRDWGGGNLYKSQEGTSQRTVLYKNKWHLRREFK